MSDSNNYLYDTKVCILDSINPDSIARLVGDLTDLVMRLPVQKSCPIAAPTVNPYVLDNLPKTPRIIDVIINSPGGNIYCLSTILHLLGIAKSKGAIIRTTATGLAGSSASMLAVQGTPGFRIMHENAVHMVHWGTWNWKFTQESEVDKIAAYMKKSRTALQSIYLKHTNIPPQRLKQLMRDEGGYLMPDECLKLGMCDWILKTNGEFVR
ncbi:ATP-dependent Clp protease proteolytic subunit [bacterium]|nr:ATP-dependent Clp protease proteolytic subunit [bacterium]